MQDIRTWPRRGVVLPLIESFGANIVLVFRVALPLLAVVLLPLADYTISVAAAESAATSTSGGAAPTAGDTDAYLAQLRSALPQGWLQREFQRQRSFSAFAHSRQLVAKGQYEEAFHELERALSRQLYRARIESRSLVIPHAAATAFCHSAAASARKIRSADREMRWR